MRRKVTQELINSIIFNRVTNFPINIKTGVYKNVHIYVDDMNEVSCNLDVKNSQATITKLLYSILGGCYTFFTERSLNYFESKYGITTGYRKRPKKYNNLYTSDQLYEYGNAKDITCEIIKELRKNASKRKK